MKLAIVGSTRLDGHPVAMALILAAFDRYRPTVLVSGGAPGIDTMAEQEALTRGVATEIYRPTVPAWAAPGGFRDRNLQIATACDALVRIVASTSRTYGSGWTRDQARAQGKPTEEFVVVVPEPAA